MQQIEKIDPHSEVWPEDEKYSKRIDIIKIMNETGPLISEKYWHLTEMLIRPVNIITTLTIPVSSISGPLVDSEQKSHLPLSLICRKG